MFRIVRGNTAVLLAAAATVALARSCSRVPLYDPVTTEVTLDIELEVELEVEVSPELELDMGDLLDEKLYGKPPEAVLVQFYNSKTRKWVTTDVMDARGGDVSVFPGTYDMLIYGMGTEATIVEENGPEGPYAYTGEVSGLKSWATRAWGDEPVVYEPDHFFVATVPGVVIPDVADIEESLHLTIDAKMRDIVETYFLEVRSVVGAGHIEMADVYISGLARQKYLWDGGMPDVPATVYFESRRNVEKGHLYTAFNTFGKLPGRENRLYLNVRVTDLEGGAHQWEFDVTDQFDDPENTAHLIVIEEEIVVPEPEGGGGGGGLDPSVHEYEEEVTDIVFG